MDEAGVIPFLDPSDPTKPLSFVASAVRIVGVSGSALASGFMFDFVGAWFDHDEARQGKHSLPTASNGDKSNDFYNELMKGSAFLYKGQLASLFIKNKYSVLRG